MKKRVFTSAAFALVLILSSVWISYADTSISVDKKNFPDRNFRTYVSESFDEDSDGYLTEEEIDNVKVINVMDMEIDSVRGVELFPELVMLNCSGNYIWSLDITKNRKLKQLYCSDNYLDGIDVSCNPELAFLYAENNNIQYIDSSGTKLDPDNGRFFYLATETILPVHRDFDYTSIPGLDFLLTSGDVSYDCEYMMLDMDRKTLSIDDDKTAGYLYIIDYDDTVDTFIFSNDDVTVTKDHDDKGKTTAGRGPVKPDTSPATGDRTPYPAAVMIIMILSGAAVSRIKRGL